MVKISLPPAFQKFTAGISSVELDAERIDQLLKALENKFPDLKTRLLNQDGEPQKFMRIFLNGDDILDLEGLKTKLKSKDSIRILMALAGG
jgi:molybdopterin synthase sulfur carrier subunit